MKSKPLFDELYYRKTAHPPRVQALKMEGTKPATETLDLERGGREASWMGRSMAVRSCGPSRNENPDASSSIAE
jgi:hypothetical protein